MQKKNIGLMMAIAFLQGMVFYSAVATLYRQQAGITLVEMAVIESISLALSLVLEVPWGLVADRLGYRRTMIVCCMLFALSKVIFWQAEGFGSFLLERVLLAITCAGLSGVDESILYLSCPEDQQQRVFGRYNALGNAGLLTASVAFTLFIGEDFRLAALLTAVAYGLAAICSLFLTEVKPAEQSVQPAFAPLWAAFRTLGQTRGMLPLVLAGGLFGEAVHYATTFLSQLQYLRCGLTTTVIGLCFTVVTSLTLVAPLSAPLTDRLGQRCTGLLLIGTGAACCLLLALTENALLSIAALVTLEVTCALYNPLHAVLENSRIHSSDRATALSINALVGSSIGVFVNMAMGNMAEASLPLALGSCALLCAMAMAAFAAIRA